LSCLQEVWFANKRADHAGGPSLRFLGSSALSIARLAAAIAASLLSDVPTFYLSRSRRPFPEAAFDALDDPVLDAAMFHAELTL